MAPPPKKLTKDGDMCSYKGDCASYCCEKNIPVMPIEGQLDMYKVRPQFYTERNPNTNTYSPPGGKVYSYSQLGAGYDVDYGCYGGQYYDTTYKEKVATAYDSYNKQCSGNVFLDLNYVDYNSTAWEVTAIV